MKHKVKVLPGGMFDADMLGGVLRAREFALMEKHRSKLAVNRPGRVRSPRRFVPSASPLAGQRGSL